MTQQQYETRFTHTDFEVRTLPGNRFQFRGYAAVFNSLSQDLGGFVERVEPGAFKKTIQESDIRALFNHDNNIVLGRNVAGTLRMLEDSTGLDYEVDAPDTQAARDLAVSMERGDISDSSFGFRAIRDAWTFTEQDYPLRSLQEVRLFDVSPVTSPAYLDTTSGVFALRSYARHLGMSDDELAGLTDFRSLVAGTEEKVEPVVEKAPDEVHAPDYSQLLELLEHKGLPVDIEQYLQ